MKPKLLCILHRAPPAHGAAKVGDFIASSKLLKEDFDLRFITIKSSDTIGDIGKISLKKIYYVLELYFKVLWALIVFQPDKIYFTASISGAAFYRDILISTLWKAYKLFKPLEVYYHYHTKGIDEFVSTSKKNLNLTLFFVNDVSLILLSPLLEKDFEKINTFKKVFYLPNGVENILENDDFNRIIKEKHKQQTLINVLYLSNMIKSKGYFDVLKLANKTKNQPIDYHFAGDWQNTEDQKEFFNYIQQNKLEKRVTFHGFVKGNKKRKLFEKAHIFIFPTRFEAFGLVITEAFSCGVPVIATDEGSIPYILDDKSGIVLNDVKKLSIALEDTIHNLVNIDTAKYCRERFLKNFTLEKFEYNLINLLKEK